MTEQPGPESTGHTFDLPDLGEGLSSAEIVDWLVAVGDEVALDQVVVVVETEKATTELPVPFSGTVARLHGEAGERVAVGAPLLTVVPSEAVAHLVGRQRLVPFTARTDGAATGLAALRRLPSKPDRARVAAAPAVRRLARELNVELASLTGTGIGGAITRDDVLAASGSEPENPA